MISAEIAVLRGGARLAQDPGVPVGLVRHRDGYLRSARRGRPTGTQIAAQNKSRAELGF